MARPYRKAARKFSPTSSPSPKANLSTSVTCDENDPLAYPEGGTQAWLVVFGAWCAMLSSMGLLNTLAVLHAWVTEYQLQGMSESATGWIFGLYGFFLYFCGAQVGKFRPDNDYGGRLTGTIGPIFDAYDIKLLVVPGAIGIVASIVCVSFSTGMFLHRDRDLTATA